MVFTFKYYRDLREMSPGNIAVEISSDFAINCADFMDNAWVREIKVHFLARIY